MRYCELLWIGHWHAHKSSLCVNNLTLYVDEQDIEQLSMWIMMAQTESRPISTENDWKLLPDAEQIGFSGIQTLYCQVLFLLGKWHLKCVSLQVHILYEYRKQDLVPAASAIKNVCAVSLHVQYSHAGLYTRGLPLISCHWMKVLNKVVLIS